MTDEEIKKCERFKEVRLSLKMKQGDFAREISTTQGHVSDIENKRKGVSDRLIAIISLKWDINEDWLRYGKYPMKKELTRSQVITNFATDLLKDEESSYRRRLIEALAALDAEDWKVLEKITTSLHKKDQD